MITKSGRTIIIRTPGSQFSNPKFEVIIHIIEEENRVDVYTHKIETKDLRFKFSLEHNGRSDDILIEVVSARLQKFDNIYE